MSADEVEPAWADLVRPAPDNPWADLFRRYQEKVDRVVITPSGPSGIVSVVPPATGTAEPITRGAFLDAVDKIMTEGAIRGPEAAPLPMTTHARQNGKTLEACLALIAEIERANSTRIILGPADWARVLAAADDETRTLLEEGQRRGVIVVSPYLPNPGVAYRVEVTHPLVESARAFSRAWPR